MKPIGARVLPATTLVRPNGLDVGMEIWRHHNPHMLRARFNQAQRRGEIAPVTSIGVKVNRYGQHGIVVKRIKPERPRWALPLAAASAAIGAVGGVAWMLYEIRWLVFNGTLTVLALTTIWWVITRVNHSGACPGLHCPGCRG